MFEKESEEYADCFWGASPSAQRAIKQAYQQGAEFGYNKAFVEADKNLKAIVTELSKAKELLRKFLDAKSIEETCVAESEAEKFLKESE